MIRNTIIKNTKPFFISARFNSTAAPAPPLLLKIREGLKAAMRSGNTAEKNVIRGILSEVKNKSIDNAASVGTDLKLHGLLRTMIVTRQKSIAEFKSLGRQDLVDKETEEVEIIKKYAGLVSVASDEELDKKVAQVIDSLPADIQTQANKVMAKIPWADVESKWNSSRGAVASSVKRVIGQRSFSTSARQMSHSNPLGLPRSRPGQPVVTPKKIPGVKHIVVVSSAKGGVGKSTVSANLALALYHMGLEVGLLDADIFGPSVPKIFNLTDAGEPFLDKSSGHLIPVSNYGIKTMSMGYLVDPNKAVAWRGLLVQKALQQLLFEVKWDSTPLSATENSVGRELDVLVLDMPPGTGDVQLTLAQQVDIDAAVLVSTPQDLALIDVVRGLDLFRIVKTPVLGVVENMSVFVCPNCHHETHIFGNHNHSILQKEAEKRGVQVLTSVPLDPEICSSADAGKPTMVENATSRAGLAYQTLARKVAEKLKLVESA